MGGMHHPRRQRKLPLRRFLNPFYTHFTTRDDGSTWSRHQQTRKVAPRYVQGILQPGTRKTMRGIAKRMDLDEDRTQRFVTQSPWSFTKLQQHLNKAIPPQIASEQAALVVDEVGLLKKGGHSVGVQRQYSGAAGRIENSQVAVDLVYATPGAGQNQDQHTWPLGFSLYLPRSWTEDQARRQEAEIPDDVEFRTKPQIAMDMIKRARDNDVPHRCVIGDTVYGDASELRQDLRDHEQAYVLGINPKKHLLALEDGRIQQDDRLARDEVGTPAELARNHDDWQAVTWSEGEKGPLSANFARWRIRMTLRSHDAYRVTDETGWLLAERVGKRTKFYLAWGFDDASLEELVMYAHLRWTIEKFHRDAKQELALDCFEGRSWRGWHHHMTLVLLAFAFLATLRAEQHITGRPPTFTTVLRVLHVERAAQLLMEQGLSRKLAQPAAEAVVRGMTDY